MNYLKPWQMDNVLMKKKVLNIDKSTWKLTKLGELIDEISKRVDNPGQSGYERFVGLEHFVSGDIKIKNWATTENLTSSAKAFKAGDILFARRNAYLRRASLIDFDGCCSGDAFVLRENRDKVVPGFMAFFFNSNTVWDFANENAAGTMSQRVKWRDLANYEFFLPPKDQQAQLAELLWAIDEVIERESALHNTIEQSKFSVLQNRIKEFSSKKQYQTLGDLGKWTSGGTPSKKNLEYWKNGTIPWITPKDMKGDYLTTSLDYVTDKSVQDNKAKIFKKGRVVLVWRSGILQHTLPIARVERDFCINQDLKVFEPKNEKFIEEFVRVFLKVNSENIRRECVKEGTTVQSIDTNSFMKFAVPEIALDLQKKIIDEEIAFESAIISGFSKYNTSKALQKSLINKVF